MVLGDTFLIFTRITQKNYYKICPNHHESCALMISSSLDLSIHSAVKGFNPQALSSNQSRKEADPLKSL